NMRGRRLGIGAAFAVLAGLLHAGGAAQGPNNRAQETVISAIKGEGLRSSEAPVLFHTLTDVFGARLTGSPAHLEAARWALERFRRWGLQNPQLEPRSEEHTSELQSRGHLVCRLLLEKKK